ncbi:MAG: hypothetical protein H6751_18810 [Candidatus Omnitrophica bacterium]|nr:hypothetical protein [Candidatus Omnitrophota bacterium]
MRSSTKFREFIDRIIERATDPSADRYLDHVRVRNFGRPNLRRTHTIQERCISNNGKASAKASPTEGLVFGK